VHVVHGLAGLGPRVRHEAVARLRAVRTDQALLPRHGLRGADDLAEQGGIGPGQFIEAGYWAMDKLDNLYAGDTSVGRVTKMVAP